MKSKLIKIHPGDNVAIALVDLWKGDSVYFEGEDIHILEDTRAKHKITMVDLAPEAPIYMYGVLVGKATSEIKKGGVLTVDNVKHQSSSVFQKTETTPGRHQIFLNGKTEFLMAITGPMGRWERPIYGFSSRWFLRKSEY